MIFTLKASFLGITWKPLEGKHLMHSSVGLFPCVWGTSVETWGRSHQQFQQTFRLTYSVWQNLPQPFSFSATWLEVVSESRLFLTSKPEKNQLIPESLNWGCSIKFNGFFWFTAQWKIFKGIFLIWLCQEYGMLSMTTEHNLDNVKYL